MQQDFIRSNPMIIKAIGEAMDRDVERIPLVDYTPSPSFHRGMENIIRKQNRPYNRFVNTTTKKTLLALAAALILMLSLVFSVSAMRKPFIAFWVEAYEKFSSIFFAQSDIVTVPSEEIGCVYWPAYLPEGYAPDESLGITFPTQVISLFRNPNGLAIELRQTTTDRVGLTINTENIQTQEVQIGEWKGLFYSNLGQQTVFWSSDDYGFTLSGPMDKETLLAVARSLKEK